MLTRILSENKIFNFKIFIAKYERYSKTQDKRCEINAKKKRFVYFSFIGKYCTTCFLFVTFCNCIVDTKSKIYELPNCFPTSQSGHTFFCSFSFSILIFRVCQFVIWLNYYCIEFQIYSLTLNW